MGTQHRPDFRQQRRHRLRLDGQHEQAALRDNRAVIGVAEASRLLCKRLSRPGDRVAGPAATDVHKTSVYPTARQRGRHAPSTEEADL